VSNQIAFFVRILYDGFCTSEVFTNGGLLIERQSNSKGNGETLAFVLPLLADIE
jgi:hypothetical protein